MPESPLALLDLAGLCSLVQRGLTPLLGQAVSLEVGHPLRAPAIGTQARTPVAIVSLGIRHSGAPREATLTLDAAFATNLVDRALGGRGQLGLATAGALPSEAECGVLAYLAAKLSKSFDGLWIRDTYASPHPPLSQGLSWPISVRWQEGSGVVWLDWPGADDTGLMCQLGWFDRMSDADLKALEPGDVLLSDSWPLSLTTQGVAGPCALRAAGVHGTLHALLSGAELQVRRVERAPAIADSAFLVLSEAPMTCGQLAALAAGEVTRFPGAPVGPARLWHAQRERARGQWVRVDRQIGMRIDALVESEPYG